MNLLGSALLELDLPIRSLYVYNSNPALVAPHANKVREGLSRDDLFTVVHDLFLTETAATRILCFQRLLPLKIRTFTRSYWHHYVHIQQPVMAPYGESKSNVDVFRLLARGMGFGRSSFPG